MKVSNVVEPTRPPKRLSLIGESRMLLDVGSMALSFAEAQFANKLATNQINQNQGAQPALPVILFPGFASDERYMKPLGLYLNKLGFKTEGWGLGVNLAGVNLDHTLEDLSDSWDVEPKANYDPETYVGEGGVPFLCGLATERVKQRSAQLESPVILIGWSLGGYLAREVARDLPEQVAQVITLGAPVIGGPKYTTAASFFSLKDYDLDWIEREVAKRDARPITQPITAIFSKTDAVVDWRAAIDKVSPNVKHISVNSSHLGMGFRRQIWRLVVAALRQQPLDG